MDNSQRVMTMDTAKDGASLRQILLILRRRWRLLAILWAATMAVGAVYTFSATKLYRPQVNLEIRPETPLVSSDTPDAALLASRTMWENYYRTQETILSSPTLLETTLRALPPAIRREYESKPDPVKAFAKQVDIEKVRTSFILKVGFVDPDPEKAQQIVNMLVKLYLEDASSRLREVKSEAIEVLSKEALPSLRQRVDEADRVLQQFKAETGFVDYEEQYASLVESRRKVVGRLTEIRLKRANLRSELEALSGYGADGVTGLYNPVFHATRALETLAQERSKIVEEIVKESKVLKEKHPRLVELRLGLSAVEEKIREAIRGTLLALQTDLDAVEREEKSLAEEQARVEGAMSEASRRLTQFKRLDTELATAKDLYHSYLKKHGETTATSGSALNSVSVRDWAKVEANPWKPNVMMNLALALVIGIILGTGAMLVAEQLDDRIASPNEVEAFVGLDVLAVVPKLKGAVAAGEKPVLLGQESPMPEFESFRGLRAQVVTRLEKIAGAKVIAILSPLEGEGKSTVVVNLARALAIEGRRVLIMDADLRKPQLRPCFGSREGVGLEELLKGEATFEQAVQPSDIPWVDVLGLKQGMKGAGELASSPRYQDALKAAREKYDYVIVDSAPVALVSESALIARRADAAILVVRERQTGRGVAGFAKKRLHEMEVRVLGAVLNAAVPDGGGYGYGYGYGYYYYYSSYGKSATG
ncbi:MAG: polysaccharide biosynthesis tyrosine autokinase [Planctomycetes bacterium]|nr:polysaccharide biosynthesis tyrosine autokinase [Planctomycetota bacterium]